MLSAINKQFWRNGIALGMLIICLWQVRMASAQVTGKNSDIVVINFPVQGWYLVSLPLAATDSSVSGVFPQALGVFTWDNPTSRYVQPTTIQIGRGYWVLMASPTAVVISGTRFSQFSGHYRVGWHLVGSLMDSVNFANPNDTPDRSVILPIFAWDAGNQRYVPRNYIEQSYGHWMLVLQECDVIVRSGSGAIVEKSGDQLRNEKPYERFGASPPPPPFQFSRPPPALPTRSTLFSSYPNPFSFRGNFGEAGIAVRYELAQAGRTQIAVYNGLGQKIRAFVEQEQPPGTHEIIWDTRDAQGRQVVSGVYYCRLVSNGFSQTQKLLVVQ